MKDTTDTWFASYLILEGFKVAKVDVFAKGKGRYYFDATDEIWEQNKLSFYNSVVSQIKLIHISLKDLVH